VAFLSRHARGALKISAHLSGVNLANPVKDKNGRPQATAGVHWSVTHKTTYVGAVVSPEPVGIDIETIAPRRSDAVLRKAADPDEWSLATGGDRWEMFHRIWTAKEAVLKATGTGLTDLSQCRVVAIPDRFSLMLQYRSLPFIVEHYYFENHIASILKVCERVQWLLSRIDPTAGEGQPGSS
jgi:4'-phosphopantetheinyl transferase